MAVAAAVAVAPLAACDAFSGEEKKDPPVDHAKASSEAPKADLARFYGQKLTWKSCEGKAKCAELEVPIDYSNPAKGTIKIALLKMTATGDRKGSLVVNPGGPGGSGVEYAQYADYVVSSSVREAYDVVGFDPRGVKRSAPVTCYSPQQMDTYLGADPTPDDAAEQTRFLKDVKGFGDACKGRVNPALLGHVSTIDAAKDMDVLRAALGDDKMDYLGKSYGTFLGATYADLFPRRVGRFVLDGVVPPDLSNSEVNKGQAGGFELATRSYVKDCIADGSCPLGSTEAQGMQRIRTFLKDVDAKPIAVTNDARVKQLTEGWASMGIAAAMYDQGSWGALTAAFRSAFKGDGNELMKLANSYAERDTSGSYQSNIMQVINAVNCLDRPAATGAAAYSKDAKDFSATAPTWGPMLAWGTAACGSWPVKATGAAKKITASGSGPILVVGTTRDPATPYEWSQRLAKMLKNGRLLTYDGDGHTAYMRANKCVDSTVDDYLLKGAAPSADKRC